MQFLDEMDKNNIYKLFSTNECISNYFRENNKKINHLCNSKFRFLRQIIGWMRSIKNCFIGKNISMNCKPYGNLNEQMFGRNRFSSHFDFKKRILMQSTSNIFPKHQLRNHIICKMRLHFSNAIPHWMNIFSKRIYGLCFKDPYLNIRALNCFYMSILSLSSETLDTLLNEMNERVLIKACGLNG